MCRGAGERRMSHPDLLACPSLPLRTRLHRGAKQRPLRAVTDTRRIDKIGRHIPPFDVKIGMRAVIGGKGKCLAWRHLRITGGLAAEARKALRCGCPAGQGEKRNAARKCAPRQLWLSAHWKKS